MVIWSCSEPIRFSWFEPIINMQIGFLRCWTTGGILRLIIDSSRDAEAKSVGDLSEMSAVQFERPNGVPLLLNPGKKHQGGITAKYQILAATEDEIFERCEEDFCCPCRVGGPILVPDVSQETKCPSSFSWSFWGFTLKLPLLNRGPFLGVSANIAAHNSSRSVPKLVNVMAILLLLLTLHPRSTDGLKPGIHKGDGDGDKRRDYGQ